MKKTAPPTADFNALARTYTRGRRVALLRTDPDGRIAAGGGCACAREDFSACRATRRTVVAESLRWGEPYTQLCPHGRLMWGVPLLHNQQLTGGLIAVSRGQGRTAKETDLTEAADARRAAAELQELAERANLTNQALLAARREAAAQERRHAEAIHAVKHEAYDSIRALYLREEPGLLAAIRGGDRGAARAIINRILVGIYFYAGARLDLLKSFALELVVMMTRAAVEAGGDSTALLGLHYRTLSELATLRDEEGLSCWLKEMLERLMDALREHRSYPNLVLLGRALQHMQAHLAEPLNRDDVARVAGLSPSHFSHLMRQKLHSSFTDVCTRMRLDKARQLLARSDLTLAEIALECGFSDQSYFTKVFRRHTRQTPRQYRENPAGTTSAPNA